MNGKEFARKAGLKYSEVRRFIKDGAIHASLLFPGCWGTGFESRNKVYFAPRARGIIKRGRLDDCEKIFWFENRPEGVCLILSDHDWWSLDEVVYSPYPCDYRELNRPDPVWQRVEETAFFRATSTLFKLNPPARTLREFLKAFDARQCISSIPHAKFFIFPTPHNRWGYVYQTMSGKQLVYTDKTIYTRGMRIDHNVRSFVASVLGEPRWDIREPRWLNRALNFRFEYPRFDPRLIDPYDHYYNRPDDLAQQKKFWLWMIYTPIFD